MDQPVVVAPLGQGAHPLGAGGGHGGHHQAVAGIALQQRLDQRPGRLHLAHRGALQPQHPLAGRGGRDPPQAQRPGVGESMLTAQAPPEQGGEQVQRRGVGEPGPAHQLSRSRMVEIIAVVETPSSKPSTRTSPPASRTAAPPAICSGR